MQMAEYAQHPRKVLDDIRWAYQLMEADQGAKAALLRQYPGLEQQFETFLGLLDIAECLPDEKLRELMERAGGLFNGWSGL